MAEDFKYIDKIVNDNLKNHLVQPNVKWVEFNDKLSKNIQNNVITGNYSRIRKYFTFKNILYSVFILSVISVVLILSTNNTKADDNTLIRSKSKTEISPDFVKPVQPSEKEDATINESNAKNLEKEKNIIIKKQVIIRDTVYL